jgi:hypothetical protein
MKKPKILGLLFVFLFANFFLIFNPAPVKAQSETQFREWSIMTFFIQCIDEQKETGKSVNSIDDLIKGSGKETIIVGLGFDRNDGAWNCETVIDKGMKILDNSLADKPESAAFNAFCEEIVGESCINGDTGMSGSKKNDNFDSLRNKAIAKRTEVNRAGKGTDRQYIQPLLTNPSGNLSFMSFCYKLQTSEPASDFDPGSEDFIVNLADGKKVWATLKRENDGASDINSVFKLKSVEESGLGASQFAAIGVKELGFEYRGGSSDIGGAGNDWNIAVSDFYPLGRHYGRLADGYKHNAAVDCAWIEKNKELVFGQIKSVSDDGSYTTNWGETASTTEEAGGVEADTCASQSGSEFGWLICPVIEAAQEFMSWLIIDGPMANILRFEVDGEGEDSLEAVWSGFRAIANILFVIVFFVVIYSAATGNVMSSYDVRKLLPRLFIVAILVQLSFFFSMFALNVANIVGDGVRDLMLFPVQGAEAVTVGGLIGDNTQNADGIVPLSDGIDAVAGGVAGIVVLIALLVVLFYSITGIIILAAVFIVRDMGIVALIVISPIAMAMNVLPGTDKYFKSWWKWYFGLLVMYPAMVAFLTSGQLMASIWNGFSDGGLMDTIITTAILFLPFFFAPKVLKFAGAAAGTLNGVFNSVQSSGGKVFGRDGLIKGNEGYKRFKTRAAGGNAFGPDSALKGLNRAARVGYNPSSYLAPGKRNRMRNRTRADAAASALTDDEKKLDAWILADEIQRIPANGVSPDTGLSREQTLREIATNSDGKQSKSRRLAAIDRMVVANDFAGLRQLAEHAEAKDAGGNILNEGEQQFWHEKVKSEHKGTLGVKAPHLLKTQMGEAVNTGVLSKMKAAEASEVHGNAMKDLLSVAPDSDRLALLKTINAALQNENERENLSPALLKELSNVNNLTNKDPVTGTLSVAPSVSGAHSELINNLNTYGKL